MAFQKHQPQRIFVEESIPRFLTEQRKITPRPAPSTVRPMTLQVNPPKPVSNESNQPAPHERRNQPMQVRPGFLAKLVVIALILNAGLFAIFHHEQGTDVLVRANESAAPVITPANSSLEERVLTYTFQQADD